MEKVRLHVDTPRTWKRQVSKSTNDSCSQFSLNSFAVANELYQKCNVFGVEGGAAAPNQGLPQGFAGGKCSIAVFLSECFLFQQLNMQVRQKTKHRDGGEGETAETTFLQLTDQCTPVTQFSI